jgi:hypothetical protein
MTWLVVGLGNPGPSYAATRHNVGYLVADVLAARMGGAFKAHTSKRADVVEGRLAGERAVLGRSRSYMNDSGGAVSTLTKYYDVEPEQLIVVQDEIDLPFGSLRVKFGGVTSGAHWAPATTSGSGSESAVLADAAQSPTTCSRPSPRRSAKSWRSTSRRPPTPSRA